MEVKKRISWGDQWLDRELIIERMEPLYTPRRLERIQKVVRNRTKTIAVGMEGLFDRGNVSAVMRSAEALGFYDVHIVETSLKFREANRVTKGAEKWLHQQRWNDTRACVSSLKQQGFRIITTHLDPGAQPISELSFSQKSVLFFGNEKDGASDELIGLSDELVILPMLGFVESFNISVAAALCLYHIQQDRIQTLGSHGDLDDEEQRDLYASYLLKGHKTQHSLTEFKL